MPITGLIAAGPRSNTPFPGGSWAVWWPGNATTAYNNIISDDVSIFGGSNLTTFYDPSRTRVVIFPWQDLPTSANGASIDFVQGEATGRRSGGAICGGYYWFLTSTAQGGLPRRVYSRIQPGAPTPPPGYRRQYINLHTPPDGGDWTTEKVNAMYPGLISNAGNCTGISVYFARINVTWRGSAGSRIVRGISWLGPLLAAGFNGLNLFHESEETLGKLNIIFRDILQRKGIQTHPTMDIREERELILNSLFVRPSYAV